jgi:hypothetical protein
MGLIYRSMAQSKTSKRQNKLTLVPPADEPTSSLPPEEADELRELIKSINGKSKRKKSREGQTRGEHDPNLPPAA